MNSSKVKVFIQLRMQGLKTRFGPIGSERFTDLLVSPKSYFQTRPHFKKNFLMNPVNSLKIKISFHPSIWGLKTRFEPNDPKRLTRP